MKKILTGFIVTFFFSGCHSPSDNLPVEPLIEFQNLQLIKDHNGKDSLALLTVYVEDGDGDLGLSASDTFPPFNAGSTYYYNFYVLLYEKTNGNWQSLPDGYNGRFPILREGLPRKPIQANITMEMDVSYWKLFLNSNIIKMDVFIFDRALHKSNTVSSEEITLNL